MFRALTFNPSRRCLWALGTRVFSGKCSESDPKDKDTIDVRDCTRDKMKYRVRVVKLGKRLGTRDVSESDPITRDKKLKAYAYRVKLVKYGLISLENLRVVPKALPVHSSEIGRAIGLCRVRFWLELIGKPSPSNRFLTFSHYRKLVKALERYQSLFPKATVKPIILESLSADPRDDLIYKIGSNIILQITCPDDLEEPYEEMPWYYILQAQALMALSDAALVVHLYCWTEGGSSLFCISRNNALWKKISLAVCDFWEDHVEPGRKRYKSGMDPFAAELVNFVPSERHRNFDDIRERCMSSMTVIFPFPTKRLHYEVSTFYLWLCEDNHFPNQLVDRKSCHMFEAPIATRFKRRDMNISDILYLGVTMYDHQHQNIPVSFDDTLLSYILHCETLSREDERLKGVSVWSSNPGELFTEAIYHALLRELVKHSQNPAYFSYLLRSLKVEAAARIKSGELSADTFLLWAKTLIRMYVLFSSYVFAVGWCNCITCCYSKYTRDLLHFGECYPVESLGISTGKRQSRPWH